MSERRVNGAVLVFLVFTTLYLVLAGLGMAGVSLAEGALLNCLLQGSLAAVCMLVLAARLKNAEKMVVGLGIALWMVPILTAGLPPIRMPGTGGPKASSKTVVAKRLAQQWAQPVELRAEWAKLATQSAYALEKYPEAPEVRAELEQRGQKLFACMREHPGEFRAIRDDLYRRGFAANPRNQSQEQFEKRYLEALSDPLPDRGDRELLGAINAQLESYGAILKAAPLSEADQKKAITFAEAWFYTHPTFLDKMITGGPAYTGDPIDPNARPEPGEDPYDSFKREKALGNPGIWIAFFGAWLAWSGRASLVRPFEAGSLLPWAAQGLRALVRPGGMPRILAGLAVMGASVGLVFLMFVLGSTAGLRKVFAAVLMAGAMLVYSGLTVSDEAG